MEQEERFSAFEVRQAGDGKKLIVGTVLRYDDVADIAGVFKERFERGALGAVGGLDVTVNVQHNRQNPIARTGAGLTLSEDGKEVRATVDFPDTQAGRDAATLVESGVLRGFSMEFFAEEERFDGDMRIVSRAKLVGIGVVDRPAYGKSLAGVQTRMEQAKDQAEKAVLRKAAARKRWL